jgi:hypothetical protein
LHRAPAASATLLVLRPVAARQQEVSRVGVGLEHPLHEHQLGVRADQHLHQRHPARAFPSSIAIIDKNRRDIGKYQSKWTASKMETPGSPLRRREVLSSPVRDAGAFDELHHLFAAPTPPSISWHRSVVAQTVNAPPAKPAGGLDTSTHEQHL